MTEEKEKKKSLVEGLAEITKEDLRIELNDTEKKALERDIKERKRRE